MGEIYYVTLMEERRNVIKLSWRRESSQDLAAGFLD